MIDGCACVCVLAHFDGACSIVSIGTQVASSTRADACVSVDNNKSIDRTINYWSMHIVYRTSSVLVHSSFHLDHHTPAWDHEEDARTLSLLYISRVSLLPCHPHPT